MVRKKFSTSTRHHHQLSTSRWKGGCNGSEIDHATNCERRRRREAFVIGPIFIIIEYLIAITGRQLRESLRKWQSPSDPSTNHNIACNRQHARTTEWFCKGKKIKKWKATGSFLWIHGKRTLLSLLMSSSDLILVFCSGLRKEHSMVC